ncbi:MAG: hypothetical protein ABI318_22960 [Chthoniobacteraceae bacterium]
MKTNLRIAFTCTIVLATTHSLRADFLELRIRETTAEHVWHWVFAFTALIVFFTLRASRSKGGQGR